MGIGRAVAAGAALLGGLALLSACGWDITKEKATDETGITEDFTIVRFDNDSGNVTITAGDSPSVRREIHYEDERPGATHRIEDGALVLGSCPVDGCWIDYEVVVPDGVRVEGLVSSGNAEVRGAGEVDVRASSGNVTVTDAGGAVNVEASSGNVNLDGIDGTAQVRASSGDVTVRLATAADVRVEANSGNVEVTVPDGSYRVEASADSGEVTNELGSDDAAGHHLQLHSDSGNVTVLAA